MKSHSAKLVVWLVILVLAGCREQPTVPAHIPSPSLANGGARELAPLVPSVRSSL